MVLVFTQRLTRSTPLKADLILALTAEQRLRGYQKISLSDHPAIYLRLPRGIVLGEGDLLQSEDQGAIARIVAKPEPVVTVTAANSLDLLRAAYHLGNRHVALEITETYLRFSPDAVLQSMVMQLGLSIQEEIVPLNPERGAYDHH
ncbi:MAG: urease accessory protein UreE [Oscillatoriales cyanobacterium RM1_1_9]|nr:urease accessory protein UreE [Oscillatoriales cyanobacterium SM2_3_0]NJO45503.1 urease accessory protein UreE [Oscillatoriales cyanobacterium RM2_1_1]NJO71901.1 urease accessory protein UreE [Oscillatoriales cyanobacterium RM1_1_9]